MSAKWLVGAAVIGLLLSVPTPTAYASAPVTGTFPTDATFVDDGASAACGFPVTVNLTGTGRFWVFIDNEGNPTRIQVREQSVGTQSANGITLTEFDNSLQTFDLAAGSQNQVGIVFRVKGPGGIAIMDRGRIIFDADGNLTFEAGPHPALDGNFNGLCAALTPAA